MSLNSTTPNTNTMLNDHDSTNLTTIVTSVEKSNNSLCRFPSIREREEFPNWLFKAEAFFAAKNMSVVVSRPIYTMPLYASHLNDNDRSKIKGNDNSDTTKVIGKNLSKTQLFQLKSLSNKAYHHIIQSLNMKQIELVRHIHIGNAYMVMKILKQNYDVIKSTSSSMSLFMKLNTNKFKS
jgi:hypothetical protein